ncbi:MAG: T9SS type A sorting domain-containing protein [Bacteroidia bacterium]|nr:T9SS type A sorting domain-containing protein [Bacteroidia bacterium]
MYINLKNATFSVADSSVLLNLCNQCPYTDGGVVYQARALFNIMNNSFSRFNDNCNLSFGSRLFDNIVKDDIDVNVLIKTKLYPNPNNGEFTVEVNKQTEGTIEEITIYDLGGKILYTNLENGSSIKVNTKLLKGSYLVKVRLSNNSVDVHRIIID